MVGEQHAERAHLPIVRRNQFVHGSPHREFSAIFAGPFARLAFSKSAPLFHVHPRQNACVARLFLWHTFASISRIAADRGRQGAAKSKGEGPNGPENGAVLIVANRPHFPANASAGLDTKQYNSGSDRVFPRGWGKKDDMDLTGIHHLTAVTRERENYRAYTQTLGMRLVKRTVNQDDVSAYHLFYADAKGSPGTDLTFFDWPVQPERRGTRSIRAQTWSGRACGAGLVGEEFADSGVPAGELQERDGRAILEFGA